MGPPGRERRSSDRHRASLREKKRGNGLERRPPVGTRPGGPQGAYSCARKSAGTAWNADLRSARPPEAGKARIARKEPAHWVIAPSSGRCTGTSHPARASAPGYRTQLVPAHRDIAPSSCRRIGISHPARASAPGYRTQLVPAHRDIAPSSCQRTGLSHPARAGALGRRRGSRKRLRSATAGLSDSGRPSCHRHVRIRAGSARASASGRSSMRPRNSRRSPPKSSTQRAIG